MNVYLHDIRLCLEDIDRLEITIRLSQMMKRTNSGLYSNIVRIEKGRRPKRRFFQRKNSFRAYTLYYLEVFRWVQTGQSVCVALLTWNIHAWKRMNKHESGPEDHMSSHSNVFVFQAQCGFIKKLRVTK